MSSNDEGYVWLFVVLGAAGIWWASKNYEVVKKPDGQAIPAPALTGEAAPIPSRRPTGLVQITTLANGTIWSLMADDVAGERKSRIAWVEEDHSANKTASYRTAKTLYKIDCETGQNQTLQIVAYKKDGTFFQRWTNFSKTPDYAVPGSVMAAVVREACNIAFDKRTG